MSHPTEMNILDTVALKNLMVLSRHGEEGSQVQWVTEGPYLKVLEEKYEGGNTASALEHRVYMTFHRLILFLEDYNRLRFGMYTKRDILRLMDHALDACHQVTHALEEVDEGVERLVCLLGEFDDRHSVIFECQNRESICHKISLWLGEKLDDFVLTLGGCRNYLYVTPQYPKSASSSEEEEESRKVNL